MINSYAEEKWKVNKPAKRQLVFATWKLVQNWDFEIFSNYGSYGPPTKT